MNFKPIPIGRENFKEIIENNCLYIDKTLMLKEIIDNTSKVILCTRPRRFGKTLNMSMIQYYFEKTDQDNSYLFNALKISQAGDKYKAHMGQYPVISLSLKSMKQATYESSFALFKKIISDEFDRHRQVLKSQNISESDKKKYESICDDTADMDLYLYSVKFLSDCLCKAYEKNVIILIDEYDVPLENAYFRGYYNEMTDLIRSVFESALKTNNSLELGILTGCLRVSKESIFTGLNNLEICSVINNSFSSYFGFTEPEVDEIMKHYKITEKSSEIKAWYNGYQFGETDIYNPWSVLKYVKAVISKDKATLLPYWSNTSSNDIIRELIFTGGEETKAILQELMNGKSVTKPVYEDITYRNVDINSDYIWSFLLFTGYLKQIDMYIDEDIQYCEMVIPNREVRSIYKNTIMQWFKEKIRNTGTSELFNAVVSGDTDTFIKEVNKWLRKCISYQDNYESFYHGFLAGLLLGTDEYTVKSNRENGKGRTDIVICEYQGRSVAVIIEIKIAGKYKELDKKCDEALWQIEERNYEAELIDDGYENIIKYGVAFCSEKVCKIKKK
ncbi:MAG: AAA family ATPase [Oscillospiraceae bacterium]|nr:AAA family ATPase [Oscillospiraceae bacterium]